MTEIEIIENINGDQRSHDKALAFLFTSKTYKDPIIGYLKSKGMSHDECNILWTDIVVKFALLVRKGKYEHQNKLGGYLKNLTNYLLLNHIRDEKKYKTDEITNNLIKDEYLEHTTINHKELKAIINEQLSLIGPVCKEILSLWSQDYSMNEIMTKLNLISAEATRKRKHICLMKLLDNISSNQHTMNLFREYYYE